MSTDFHQLDPVTVLEAIESLGFLCNGQLIELNSYENRVYQIGLEEADPLIAKFYRPQRWSDSQILEEHQFTQELANNDISVVPPVISFPLTDHNGASLHHYQDFRFALYKRYGGRSPNTEDLDCLEVLGRYIARIHLTGGNRTFTHRPNYSVEAFGNQSVAFLVDEGFLPPDLLASYLSVTDVLLSQLTEIYAIADNWERIRIHGDCHMGNVLWRDGVPHFVDFDDARNGLAIQDLWMLLSGDRTQQTQQLNAIVKGYRQFNHFDPPQLRLVESLRCLRMMYYSAWIARRWSDPAFPRAFPWFNTEQYWGQHILELKEQISRLQEPTLELFL
ncbi:MAG: serine/threonine protein kinase [Gammaproteobacteria bacterium]|nr:serine/threonine protein kinase [Gammaproteobacteria bacterium]